MLTLDAPAGFTLADTAPFTRSRTSVAFGSILLTVTAGATPMIRCSTAGSDNVLVRGSSTSSHMPTALAESGKVTSGRYGACVLLASVLRYVQPRRLE